jgi:hypothetical protein
MDQKTVATSLLGLNEYCLLDIFKFLKLTDLVNLDKTCVLLKFIGARVCAQKCKTIEVQVYKNKGMNKKEFSSTLSVIGEHISSLSVDGANQLILQLIKDKCKNINSLELCNYKGPIELQCFKNLKELKLNAVPISTNELKNCFAKNAELECLEYDCTYGEDFLELVDMLPRLQSLHIDNLPASIHLNQHLHCLDGLTKFSFYSPDNCNQLLMKLTKNSKLKELHIWMPLDADTFNIIALFPSLEIISVHQFGEIDNLPEHILFPPTLKSVKVTGVKMSCKTLLSAVKQVKSLEEFDLGYVHDLDKSKLLQEKLIVFQILNVCLFISALHLNDKSVITQIEVGLKAEFARRQQPLKIIYYDRQAANKQLVSTYCISYLKSLCSEIQFLIHYFISSISTARLKCTSSIRMLLKIDPNHNVLLWRHRKLTLTESDFNWKFLNCVK